MVLTVFFSIGTSKPNQNSQKQSKDSQNSKNDHWCTNRHMSTQSPPNTQSPHSRPRPRPRPPNTQCVSRASLTKPEANKAACMCKGKGTSLRTPMIYSPVSEEQIPAHSPIWSWVLLSAQGWSTFPWLFWLCGHELLMKLFRTANKDIIDECRFFCNFPLPTEMLEIKSNKFCKKFNCNKSMLRYFNISVS